MKVIFESLKELQQVYGKKLNLEKEIQEIHTRVENNKEVLIRLEEKEVTVGTKLVEILKQERLLKSQSAEVEANREKTEFRIAEIKTQREYEALEKEIKAFSLQESSLRREIESVKTEREEIESEKEHLVALISAQKQEIDQEKDVFADEIKGKEKTLSVLEKEEGRLCEPLSEDLRFKFKRIVRKKEKSIVAMRNGVCTGCYIQLPLQFANEVRRENEIHFCPNCSRILYFEDAEVGQELLEMAGGLGDLIGDLE